MLNYAIILIVNDIVLSYEILYYNEHYHVIKNTDANSTNNISYDLEIDNKLKYNIKIIIIFIKKKNKSISTNAYYKNSPTIINYKKFPMCGKNNTFCKQYNNFLLQHYDIIGYDKKTIILEPSTNNNYNSMWKFL